MPEPIRSYEDLRVWQEAMALVELTYELAKKLPASERFGLMSQMTRAAVSVPANIAEGHSSSHRAVYLRFLSIARGSLAELETYAALVVRLRLVTADEAGRVREQARCVGRLLNALIRSLRPTASPGP